MVSNRLLPKLSFLNKKEDAEPIRPIFGKQGIENFWSHRSQNFTET